MSQNGKLGFFMFLDNIIMRLIVNGLVIVGANNDRATSSGININILCWSMLCTIQENINDKLGIQ